MKFFNAKIIDRNRFNDYSQVSLTFLAIAIFAIFAIRPSLVKAYQLYRDVREYNDLSETLRTKVSNLDKFDKLKETNPKIFELIDKALPMTRDEAGLIRSFNLIASENLVVLQSLVFNQQDSEQDVANSLEVLVEVEGTYEKVLDFISSVTNAQRIMSVESVDLTLTSNGLAYSAKIKVKAFYNP